MTRNIDSTHPQQSKQQRICVWQGEYGNCTMWCVHWRWGARKKRRHSKYANKPTDRRTEKNSSIFNFSSPHIFTCHCWLLLCFVYVRLFCRMLRMMISSRGGKRRTTRKRLKKAEIPISMWQQERGEEEKNNILLNKTFWMNFKKVSLPLKNNWFSLLPLVPANFTPRC